VRRGDRLIRPSRGWGWCPRQPRIRAAGGSRASGDRPRGGHPVLAIKPGRRVHCGEQLIHQVRSGTAPPPPGAETHDARQQRPSRPGNGFVTAPAFRCDVPWSTTFWFRPPRNGRVEFGSRAPDRAPGALCNPFDPGTIRTSGGCTGMTPTICGHISAPP
jgi:hypothetical protein